MLICISTTLLSCAPNQRASLTRLPWRLLPVLSLPRTIWRLSQRVCDTMGDQTQKSFAPRLGISLPTLRKVLAGEAVRADVWAKIEAKLR